MLTESPRELPSDLAFLPATQADLPAILALQRIAYQDEAELYNDWCLPPLQQSLAELQSEWHYSVMIKAVTVGQIVGSVRATCVDGVCRIGRLIVDPAYRRRGIGEQLLAHVEACFSDAASFALFTGHLSVDNIRRYQRAGYAIARHEPVSPAVTLVHLEKTAGV
ncbi:GNAT family N-acetyltransferase [Andreprevotia chitinilytica]|uniref:GNAT family N-acetyltransferase n=1 Tax=Andreprevotia chitinilytica TaxID=396808 RepID=UPI00068C059F|nr:GNAT family N-acetyltransferase [Andreprevotia chitinilytica]